MRFKTPQNTFLFLYLSRFLLSGLFFFSSTEVFAFGGIPSESKDQFATNECRELVAEHGEHLSNDCSLEACQVMKDEYTEFQVSYGGKTHPFPEYIKNCEKKAQTAKQFETNTRPCTQLQEQYGDKLPERCLGDQCLTHSSYDNFDQYIQSCADEAKAVETRKVVNKQEEVEKQKELYMKECFSMLEEINQIKPSELLCPSAELSDNEEKCTEFCQQELDKSFNNRISVRGSDLGVFQSQHDQIEVSVDIRDLKASIITDNGELKTSSGFTWFICEKGEEQNCEVELVHAFEEAAEICATLQKEAHECCHSPEQCVGGGLATALDGLGKMHIGISGLKGPKEQCKAVRQTFGLFSSMQGAMATQCTRKANACQEGCAQEQRRVAEQFKQACNHDIRIKADYDENEHTCDEEFFKHYRSQYKKNGWSAQEDINISLVPEQCERTGREANRNIQAMSTNLGTSLMASMKECGETPEPLKWETPKPPKFQRYTHHDPPPTPSPRPMPTPSPYLGGGGREPTTNRPKKRGLPTPNTPGPAADPLGVEPDLPDDPEKDGPGAPGGMGGLLGGSGGSSGMGGFGLSGGGGGGSPGGEGNDDDSPKSNKILHGYAGGKFAGYGGGGSVNQGGRKFKRSAKNKKNKRKLARLNLKKILPKGKQLNHKVGKFGSPHDNIFQRMSNRYQWLCRTNKMNCR